MEPACIRLATQSSYIGAQSAKGLSDDSNRNESHGDFGSEGSPNRKEKVMIECIPGVVDGFYIDTDGFAKRLPPTNPTWITNTKQAVFDARGGAPACAENSSLCVTCGKEMPWCWNTSCRGCGATSCYQHSLLLSNGKAEYWFCPKCNGYVQYRFPRSKKSRIRRKWAKLKTNWRRLSDHQILKYEDFHGGKHWSKQQDA
jgi:hypothetical protein